ncbi:MAG: L-lactate dehydrogenase [Planctomycetota bacterium]
MDANKAKSRKVVVVGAGDVGATFAYALAQDGTASEIVLTDVDRDTAEGQVLDLAHGLPFFEPVHIRVGDKSDYRDASVIVITAGAAQKVGESRLDLLRKNAKIMENVVDDITSQPTSAVMVVVSNPVDVLTYVALKRCGWPKSRVMGSGTVLDTARFKYILSNHCGVDARNVHAYILGEHGDSEIAAWSMSHIAGLSLSKYCSICGKCEDWRKRREEMVQQVRHSAYHIIDYKGSTNFAIGMALVRIVGAMLRNEHSVLTVSSYLNGEYGVDDICLSVPCMLSNAGVERVLEGDLTEAEREGLHNSARVLRESVESLKYTGRG